MKNVTFTMAPTYIKVPLELIIFALKNRKINSVTSFLASKFIWPGKVKKGDRSTKKIAKLTNLSERTVYRSYKWLLQNNWMEEDHVNGWLFFRGLDQVHQIQDWKYSRAALMWKTDLITSKPFFAGAVLASLVKTGKGHRAVSHKVGHRAPRCPISQSLIAKVLSISLSQASKLRKLANKHGYIKNLDNNVRITNLTPSDLTYIKASDLPQINVQLLGYPGSERVQTSKIRYKNGNLYLQQPNLIEPKVKLKNR